MSAKKVWIIIYLQVYVNNIEQGEIQHDGNVQVPSVTVDYDKTLALVSFISILKILVEVSKSKLRSQEAFNDFGTPGGSGSYLEPEIDLKIYILYKGLLLDDILVFW